LHCEQFRIGIPSSSSVVELQGKLRIFILKE
jgi:hypothetical protein